jgi:hypothetical protein
MSTDDIVAPAPAYIRAELISGGNTAKSTAESPSS